jgi:radical SAM protein with 4Fe4S-binding SPASM domain
MTMPTGESTVTVPRRSYLDFSAAIHERAEEERFPLDGTLELTHRCNLACVHCYVNLPANDREARARELTREECCRVIDAMAEEGCLYLLITGGEPLLRRDFRDIYLHAKRRGMLITLFTNGCLVTPEMADFLAEYPPFSVEITLYGASEAVYERVTGIPGAYEKCLRGIRLLRERRLPLRLKTVGLSLNRHEVADMQRLADELGVAFKVDPHIHPRIDCSHQPCETRMSPEEVVALDLADPELAEAWREEFLPENLGVPDSDRLYLCGAGVANFVVDPYGELEMCLISRHSGHNLREKGFREGFYDYFPMLRALKRERPTRCRSCDLVSACRTCPGTSVLEHGDRETPVDYLCEITHLRAEAFGGRPRSEGLLQIAVPQV